MKEIKVMEKVTPESLKKAMETLGLSIAEPDGSDSNTTTVVSEDTELQKAEKELELLSKKIEELKNPAAPLKTEVINKAEIAEEIVKSFDPKFKALGMLLVDKDAKIEEISKAVNDLSAVNEELSKRLGLVERTPLERKSITNGAKHVERFEKAEGGENGLEGGMKVLSIGNSTQRRQISKTLLDEAIKTGTKDHTDSFVPNQELAKAAQYVELRQVPAAVRQILQDRFKIKVIA